MVPWTFHIPIARQCIANRVHMLTASYVSPAMAELHDEASRAGVCLMNEIGLDPGVDHMLAMQFIDNVHAKGGKVCFYNRAVLLCLVLRPFDALFCTGRRI